MKVQIKHRDTGAVLYEGEHADTTGALVKAVDAGAYLARAYLARANLDGANLARANLDGAYLTGAYLARANLTGANLTGANLTGANLTRANLTGANLDGANLTRANLTGAYLADNTTLPEGVTFGVFKAEVMPALLTANGKDLLSFKEHWACHTWENCPVAYAFDVRGIDKVPAVWKPWANRFINLYDAKHLPWEIVEPLIPVAAT